MYTEVKEIEIKEGETATFEISNESKGYSVTVECEWFVNRWISKRYDLGLCKIGRGTKLHPCQIELRKQHNRYLISAGTTRNSTKTRFYTMAADPTVSQHVSKQK